MAAASTLSGDVIDLSSIPTPCSKITLSHGAIEVQQDSLYLEGPGAEITTIDADQLGSAFYHFGNGTLGISGLTISNGLYVNSVAPKGGCIYSRGSVFLFEAIVSNCTLESASAMYPALGGAVYARDNLTLVGSTISNSHAVALNGSRSTGGGAFAYGDVFAKNSTITGNTALYAGGGAVFGDVFIDRSTISGNSADAVGALELGGGSSHGVTISNSTVSGNSASEYAGIWTASPLSLSSSTIALNSSQSGVAGKADGLFSAGAALTVQNSIIADNAGLAGPSDFGAMPAAIALSGGENIITSSTLMLPAGFALTSACPQLEPLADNGGDTWTHALRLTSPAIDSGNAGNLPIDQRGMPRPAGLADDIGAFEWQPGNTDERVFVDGFDGLCDR